MYVSVIFPESWGGLTAPTGSSLGVDHDQDGKERLVWADLSLSFLDLAFGVDVDGWMGHDIYWRNIAYKYT